MARKKLEEIIEELREQGLDELAEELEGYTGTALRRELEAKARRVEELEQELRAYKVRPAREKAFRDYGIDLDSLRPLEREALFSQEFSDDVPTPEEIGALVERYGLPVGREEQETAEEAAAPPAAGVTRAAMSAPAGKPAASIGPEDIATWPAEKLMAFREANPDKWQALLRGERVSIAP